MKSTIEQLKKYIDEAEYVVIGAGAGLSTAAGFEYGGATFLKHFKRMHDLYGYTDMYSAGFHNFKTSEEKWGYWSKFIYLNRYSGVKQLYLDLLEIVKDKDYFVLTTNVDHQFQLAGFDKSRLFYTQGDYGLFQCSTPCHNKTYDNEEQVRKMLEEQVDGKIPSYLIPHCPVCGEEMDMNLRKDDTFVEDEGWHRAAERYSAFIRKVQGRKVLYLELGVGMNTPVIIKYPFINFTYQNKNAHYVSVNLGGGRIPLEIADRSLVIDGDIKEVVQGLLNH